MKPFRSPMIAIVLSETGASADVQLFRTGTFFHEQYGKFTIDTKMLQEMQNNFQSKVRGVDIAIDYKHDSDDVAAGWIKEVYLSQDGAELWAKVDWTPNGKKILSEKEFRYLSPEFVYEYQDNESLKTFGAVLLGAGLTNRPVIKKMEPVVQLSEYSDNQNISKPGGNMDDLSKMTPEQLIAMIKDLQAKLQGMQGMENDLAEYKKKAAEMDQAKACAEKKAQFAMMLAEGKVCKAQEQAFISGDMSKFVELAQPLKLNEGQGSSVIPPAATAQINSKEDAQDAVIKLAEAKMKEDKNLDMSGAIKKALIENPELKQKIYA